MTSQTNGHEKLGYIIRAPGSRLKYYLLIKKIFFFKIVSLKSLGSAYYNNQIFFFNLAACRLLIMARPNLTGSCVYRAGAFNNFMHEICFTRSVFSLRGGMVRLPELHKQAEFLYL